MLLIAAHLDFRPIQMTCICNLKVDFGFRAVGFQCFPGLRCTLNPQPVLWVLAGLKGGSKVKSVSLQTYSAPYGGALCENTF